MPMGKTDSPLKHKYGEKNVARARDLIKARMGIPLESYGHDDTLPWAIIGKISQSAKKAGKIVSMGDIKAAQRDYKKDGVDPSLKTARRKWEKAKGEKTHLKESMKVHRDDKEKMGRKSHKDYYGKEKDRGSHNKKNTHTGMKKRKNNPHNGKKGECDYHDIMTQKRND